MRTQKCIVESFVSNDRFVFDDMHLVDTTRYQFTISNASCLVYLRLRTDYSNLFSQLLSRGKPVSFSFSRADEVLTSFNYVFMVTNLRRMN